MTTWRYSPRQFYVLNKIGIDVWILRSDKKKLMNETKTKLLETSTVVANQSNCSSLKEISIMVKECRRCKLYKTRTNTVFGRGNIQADWFFIGEAPGQEEDKKGIPFIGRAGKLLDLMISALGIKQSDVYIANILKCRPPKNRDPLIDEISECRHYVLSQLKAISPKIIILLGRISAKAILKTNQTIGELRGQIFYFGTLKTPLIVTYHPAYLLRNPRHKSKSWEDLWLAKSIIE